MLAPDALSDALVSGLADRALLRTFSYIGGRWAAAGDGATIPVTDPATGDYVGHVASLSAADSAGAVDAAEAAFSAWAAALTQARGALLRRWAELMLAHREDLARSMTFEQGKPLSEARGEIDYAASFVEIYAEEAKRPNIESVTSHLPDAEVELWREPVGVAALITPWNFPRHADPQGRRRARRRLRRGRTSSAETPFSALALAELTERAGFPAASSMSSRAMHRRW